MKRFTVALICILLSVLALCSQTVFAAENTYARAANRNAYFFKEKDSASSLFAVPYTYCVEIIRDEGDWYYVRYASDTGIYKALYGYCRKEDFTVESTTPKVTYLYKTVSVKYSSNTGSSTLPVLGTIELDAAYYGTYYSGASAYSYVYCQGSFGYIVGANDDYELNLPEEKPSDSDDKTDGGETEKKSGASFGLIAFIVIAVLFSLVIAVIWFTSKRPRRDG